MTVQAVGIRGGGLGYADRLKLHRQHILDLNDAGVRRTTFFDLLAESLRQTVGEDPYIRRAKAFANVLDRAELAVLPYELLAGSILGTWPLAENLPTYAQRRQEAETHIVRYRARKETGEITDQHLRRKRWAMMARDHYDANLDYRDLQRLIEEMQRKFAGDTVINAMEIGRELEHFFNFNYSEAHRLMRELPWSVANHLDLNFPKAVKMGFGGILADINSRLASATDPGKQVFYESTKLAIKASIRFVRRYVEALRAEADKDHFDPSRPTELRRMAETCQAIAEAPPATFREAIQLVWMVHIISNIAGGSAMSFARFDQYLHPFYARDMAAGRVTRDEVKALLASLWVKVNEPHMRTVQSLCLAGTTPDGRDAANEFTAVCLEVCGEAALPYPNTAVRFSRQSPEWLYDAVARTIKLGVGQPMILNDDTWVTNFIRLGYRPEDARDYYNMGCVEMMVAGRMVPAGGGGGVNFASLVELVLNNGRANMGGETGLATGEPDSFETFDQFLDAYCAQVKHFVDRTRAETARIAKLDPTGMDPFASALVGDCLERGLDLYQGGAAVPPVRRVGAVGLGTGVDSLAAIKRFVFDEKKITLPELAEALASDFSGREDLRVMLEQGTRCFGNDDDDADRIARRIFGVYGETVHALNDGRIDGVFVTSPFSYTGHIYHGETTGALPNGRHARRPISDGIGPSQGRDVRGPTSLVKSVTKLDCSLISGACALNMKFTGSVLSGPSGEAALKDVIKTYLRLGGAQLQVNVVSAAALRDAQEHPERYRNVIVRIGGFSDFFVALDRELQDEIIARTEQTVV